MLLEIIRFLPEEFLLNLTLKNNLFQKKLVRQNTGIYQSGPYDLQNGNVLRQRVN